MRFPVPHGAAFPGDPPARADVVVIGGGLPGLTAARVLAAAGTKVVVLEAAPHLGAGTSGRHAGLALATLAEPAVRLAEALGDEEAASLLRYGFEGLDDLARLGVLERTGVRWAAAEEGREADEVRRSAETLARLGVRAALVGPDALAGTGFVTALTTLDEGLVDPEAAVQAAARAAVDAGAQVVTGWTVRAVGHAGDDLVVLADRAEIRATAVVLAAEAGLHALWPGLDTALVVVREQAVRLQGGALDLPLRATHGWVSARPVAGGTVVTGARFASPNLEVGVFDDTTTTPPIQAWLERFAARHVPGVGPATDRWSWITAHGCDGLPIVGPLPDDPRVVVCGGFAGLEASLGVRSGRAVAEGLLRGRAEGVPRCLASHRFVP